MNGATVRARIQTLHTRLETARLRILSGTTPVAGLSNLPCRVQTSSQAVPVGSDSVITVRWDILPDPLPPLLRTHTAEISDAQGRITRYRVQRAVSADSVGALLRIEAVRPEGVVYG